MLCRKMCATEKGLVRSEKEGKPGIEAKVGP